MSNAKIVFLTFYLLFSTPMHCMKRTAIDESAIVHINPTKPQTIQELQKIRDSFIASKINRINNNNNFTNVDLILFQEYWTQKDFPHPLLMGDLGFSPIIILTMALKSPKDPTPVDFLEKKEKIQKLLNRGFIPTSLDKKYALLEKWERCKTVIQNIFFFHYTAPEIFLKLSMPQELIDYISLLMFETEESLL